MRIQALLLLVIALLVVVAPRAHAETPAKEAETPAKEAGPAGATAKPSVRRRSTAIAVTLDKPPIVRVRLSFDHQVKGTHVEIEWDPARPVSLTQIVRLPGGALAESPPGAATAAVPAGWKVSLWAEPTLLTAGNTAYFLVLDAEPELLTDVVLPAAETPAAEETCPARAIHEEKSKRPDAVSPGKEREAKLARQPCGLHAAIGNRMLSAPPSVQELHATLRLTDTSAERDTRAPFAVTPAAFGAGARSADPISGVASELLTVIAEVAIDRAKSRGLQILTDRIQKAVCEQLVWTQELRSALRVADASLDGGALLPGTCDLVKHMRIQELGSTAKGMYTAIMVDLAGIGMKAVASVAGERLLDSPGGRALLALLQNPTRIAALIKDAPSALELTALIADLTPAKDSKTVSAAKLPAIRKQIATLAELVSLVFQTLPLCEQAKAAECAAVATSFGALAAELKRPLFDLAKVCEKGRLAVTAFRTLRRTTALDGLLEALSGEDEQLVHARLLAYLGQIKAKLDDAKAAAEKLAKFAKALEKDPLSAVVTHMTMLESEVKVLASALGLGLSVPAGEKEYAKFRLLSRFIAKVGSLAAGVATGGLPPDRAAQALLADLAGERWAEHLCTGDRPQEDPRCQWACGAEAGWAILGPCAKPGGECTAASIAFDLAHLDETVEGDSAVCKAVLAQPENIPWAKIEEMLLAALEILHPRPDANPKTLALAAIRATFDTLEAVLCKERSTGTCVDLGDAREIAVSLAEEQPARTLVAASKLIGRVVERTGGPAGSLAEQKGALIKLTRVIGAFTAYASTYAVDAGADEQKIKEQHEARKKAIEGLIDATTDRSQREGEWVFSLGVAAGFDVVSGQLKTGETMLPTAPQLVLPMGLALQKLPAPQTDAADVGVGFHLQLSPIDLAQFVAYDDKGAVSTPSWGSAFVVGGQVGVLLGTPRDSFVLGVDVRYSPTLFPVDGDVSKGAGAFRLGLFAAYYVPLFDFN